MAQWTTTGGAHRPTRKRRPAVGKVQNICQGSSMEHAECKTLLGNRLKRAMRACADAEAELSADKRSELAPASRRVCAVVYMRPVRSTTAYLSGNPVRPKSRIEGSPRRRHFAITAAGSVDKASVDLPRRQTLAGQCSPTTQRPCSSAGDDHTQPIWRWRGPYRDVSVCVYARGRRGAWARRPTIRHFAQKRRRNERSSAPSEYRLYRETSRMSRARTCRGGRTTGEPGQRAAILRTTRNPPSRSLKHRGIQPRVRSRQSSAVYQWQQCDIVRRVC